MQFRRLLRLFSSASSGQPLSRVARFFASSSSVSNAGLGLSAGYSEDKKFESSQNLRVSVWWDFEDCHLPVDADVFKVEQAIIAVIRNNRIRGPITITAFGNLYKLSRIYEGAFSSTNIVLKHVPRREKTSANLLCWVSQVPSPAHIFLISSDRVFAQALRKLRRENYNILLASKTYEPDVLFSAATIMWDWSSLVERRSVTGICFNQPPYDPCIRTIPWIPLQDSFAAVEESNSVKTEESSVPNSILKSEETPALSKTPLWLDSSPDPSSSGSTGSGSRAVYSSSRCLQQDLNVNVFVWWDFRTCSVPVDTNLFKVPQAITAAIRSCGIMGPIEITSFGDHSKLSKIEQIAFTNTAISLRYWIPTGGNSIASFVGLVSMDPPLAHIFLISNDKTFASALHELRKRNYNILVASKTCGPDVFGAATIMWDWCSLLEGKIDTSIRLNQPPCDRYNSWYGRSMILFQDPLAAVEQSNSMKIEESPASNFDLKKEESLALSKNHLRPDFSPSPSTLSYQRVGEKETDKIRSTSFFDRILKWFKIYE